MTSFMPMFKTISAAALAVILWAGTAPAQTVVSHETDKYFFEAGKMTRFDGQFENTYEVDLEKGTVTRTRVYDFTGKRIMPDDTVYRIEKDLLSNPGKHNRYVLPPVVRAVGKPDADSVEIVVIEQAAVTTARSTSNEIIVSRGRRLS